MKYRTCFLLAALLLTMANTTLFSAGNGVGIESLGHVGIAVSDAQRALHFYIGQLGLKEAFQLNRPDGSPRLVYLQVGQSSTFVELFPGTKTSSSPRRHGPYHFGFFVKNLQATLHMLQARGYRLPADAFRQAAKVQADGTLLYFIDDPDGNRIELSQVTPQSYQAKAAPELLVGSASTAKASERRH